MSVYRLLKDFLDTCSIDLFFLDKFSIGYGLLLTIPQYIFPSQKYAIITVKVFRKKITCLYFWIHLKLQCPTLYFPRLLVNFCARYCFKIPSSYLIKLFTLLDITAEIRGGQAPGELHALLVSPPEEVIAPINADRKTFF